MLELFLKLIDKLIQLESVKKQNKKELFLQHIHPIFETMSDVYKNYLVELNALGEIVDSMEYDQFVKEVKKRRQTYQKERSDLVHYTLAIYHNDEYPQDVRFFCYDCFEMIQLEPNTELVQGFEKESSYSRLQQLIKRAEETGSLEGMRDFIGLSISSIEKKWILFL